MADDAKRMNVLYSSDDNYAQHMGVSIYSLLRHNAEFENIRLYVSTMISRLRTEINFGKW